MSRFFLRPLLAFAVILVTAAAHAAAPRWNILFCFADDWGRYASCYAKIDGKPSINDAIKTPSVDRLAREGVLFRNAFVNAPSCTPCRSSLVSGRYFFNCGRGAILNKKDVRPGAARFGYSHLYGGIPGGQAEYVRVPKANVGPLKVPDGLADDQVLFLSDILPAGYQAAINAGVKPGSTVAIFGAGPVGYMSAACARVLGADRIFMVDHHDYRLRFAVDRYGVEPVNFDREDDPAERIVHLTKNRGVDCCIDAIGFEAKGSKVDTTLTNLKMEGSSGAALRQQIACTRRGGTISVPGVYVGVIHAFLFGEAFEKGITFKTGQTHVQKFMPVLLDLVANEKIRPEIIISHHLPLVEAPYGYEMFDERQEECRKVVLTPQ